MLTEGAIQDILFKPAEQHPQKPIFQILGIKKIQTKSSDGAGNDRYRLVVSDGINLYTSAMLATQLNDLVISKHIEAKAVVQLDKYICNIIQETRKVLIVLEVSVLKTANEVVGKIGDPKPINVESKPEQQQQHQNLQQNVSGPVQRNMSDDFHQNQPQRGSAGQVPAQQQSRAGVMGGNKLGAPVRTGGLASATYGSNQQVSRGGNNPKPVYPISSLTPYQNRWTIRVRVTSKSNIRTWSNSKGEGRLFNVDFVDESGEIRATGFNDVVDKFYELLEVNKVYYISKCSLKTANKQYSSIKNDYEMYINNDTIIELCHDPCDLPTIQYNFVSIGDLSNCNGNDIVDILGVVINIDEVSQITTRASNRQISKRDIMLLDRSEKSVRATLWGDYAEKFEDHNGKNPVLALKGVKVSEYGGRSLSVLNSTNIMVNPLDLKEAHSLRGWYMNVGKDTAIESMSGQRSDGSLGAGSYKTLLQVKSEQLGMGDKPDYFTAKATAVFFKKDNCLYKACPSPECNKKVIEEGDGTYRCEKCNKTHPDFKYRLILSANLADFSGNQWVTCFQDSAEAILNTSASHIGQMKDSNDEQAYDQIFSEANFKTYNFRIRAKMETYNDETRLKCSCMGATPLDFQKECRRLIEEIKKLQAL
ncbi:PREDICTED: replication protein A 70 kDa DNA-binding subunit-like [Acropora digitifera]|uniref:replication protein A 70 kDa DNA-binding subunit-like n=1 Tax=Acropora digitifera TaxID=70779 RepID=UPI00077AE9C6|nr:PREDICTED: replication protein A 70 kDa DNA-binding subunit-like [Acropora digitifera]